MCIQYSVMLGIPDTPCNALEIDLDTSDMVHGPGGSTTRCSVQARQVIHVQRLHK